MFDEAGKELEILKDKRCLYVFLICILLLAGCQETNIGKQDSAGYDVEHAPSEIAEKEMEPDSSNGMGDVASAVSVDPPEDGHADIPSEGDAPAKDSLDAAGTGAGGTDNAGQTADTSSTGSTDPAGSGEPSKIALSSITEDRYKDLENKKESWSFKRMADNQPVLSYEAFDINEYNSFYIHKNVEEGDKVIYLTFDCGYENGFTPAILAALKEHNAKAMFFVTEYFIEKNAALVIQMKEEGHMVGNHTLNHKSLPEISIERLKEEVIGLEQLMYDKTGYAIDPFIRPPMGEYSRRTLKALEDMGYRTVFWSIAYLDYDVENQPGKEFVINHFKNNHHNGAVPLIHNVSKSNAEAMDAVLSLLEEAGYRFGTLDEVPERQ